MLSTGSLKCSELESRLKRVLIPKAILVMKCGLWKCLQKTSFIAFNVLCFIGLRPWIR